MRVTLSVPGQVTGQWQHVFRRHAAGALRTAQQLLAATIPVALRASQLREARISEHHKRCEHGGAGICCPQHHRLCTARTPEATTRC